jgi:hypothetical protein
MDDIGRWRLLHSIATFLLIAWLITFTVGTLRFNLHRQRGKGKNWQVKEDCNFERGQEGWLAEDLSKIQSITDDMMMDDGNNTYQVALCVG